MAGNREQEQRARKMQLAQERWKSAAHAMQSGVAMEMEMPGRRGATEPKHLRVGVNTALRDQASLVKLLIDHGVIDELDYYEALAEGMEEEKASYEARLSKLLQTTITLG